MSKTPIDPLVACQQTRWAIVKILVPAALTIAGGLFAILWEIRGDVQYTKGRVDVLVKPSAPSTTVNDADPALAAKNRSNP